MRRPRIQAIVLIKNISSKGAHREIWAVYGGKRHPGPILKNACERVDQAKRWGERSAQHAHGAPSVCTQPGYSEQFWCSEGLRLWDFWGCWE